MVMMPKVSAYSIKAELSFSSSLSYPNFLYFPAAEKKFGSQIYSRFSQWTLAQYLT